MLLQGSASIDGQALLIFISVEITQEAENADSIMKISTLWSKKPIRTGSFDILDEIGSRKSLISAFF